MNEIIESLSKEIPYQWRVQSRTKDRTKALCTSYIDARDVMNLLDQNCIWKSEFKEIQGFIFAGIAIYWKEHGEWVWRWDCGQRIESDPNDQMYEQAGKSASSDAFKRAAVQWGVGRFLYDIPTVSLPCDQYGNVVDDSGKRVWDLTAHINGLKSWAPKNEAPKPEPTEAPELPQDKLDSMLKYLQEGKVKEVESAMKKYKLSNVQKQVLTKMINQVKTNAVTSAAKQ